MSCFGRDIDDRAIMLAMSLISILVFIVFVGIIMVDDLLPDVPEFTLISFTLTGLNVSAASQHVGGNWGAGLQIKSKYSKLGYEDLESLVSYNSEVLSHANILSFNQRAHKLTLAEVHYSALDGLTGQRDAIVSPATVTALTTELGHRSVGFDMRIGGKVRISGGLNKQLQVLCGVIPITVSEDGVSGKFNGFPHKCEVKTHDLSRTALVNADVASKDIS